jgi:hypothetical protein
MPEEGRIRFNNNNKQQTTALAHPLSLLWSFVWVLAMFT